MDEFIPCIPQTLPDDLIIQAAAQAVEINPANRPAIETFPQHMPPELELTPFRLAVLTSSWWGSKGVDLTVGFPFDSTPADLQKKFLEFMNHWGGTNGANVRFRLTTGSAQVRISRAASGYWSYVGSQILSIPANKPTTNFQNFTMSTPESEWFRVVEHETLHLLGGMHEHQRPGIIALLDEQKTIAWGREALGWNEQTVRQQILTPLAESSILATPFADPNSIGCYGFPGSITKNGQPIPGGKRITTADMAQMIKIYPPKDQPPQPPTGEDTLTIVVKGKGLKHSIVSTGNNGPELPPG